MERYWELSLIAYSFYLCYKILFSRLQPIYAVTSRPTFDMPKKAYVP